MGEDRALDEFLDGEDEAGDGGSENAGAGGDAEADADGESESDEARAVSTTAFAPEGTPCEACGATVRRRWRDDGALVCRDCKAW